MSEMMKCFVMHGIGQVGFMAKPIPRLGPMDANIPFGGSVAIFSQGPVGTMGVTRNRLGDYHHHSTNDTLPPRSRNFHEKKEVR